jgi:hypothetical protein
VREEMPQRSIVPGVVVLVTDSRGRDHRKVALSRVVAGRDIPVIWACREDEWEAARREQREPEGVPWPAKDVRLA